MSFSKHSIRIQVHPVGGGTAGNPAKPKGRVPEGRFFFSCGGLPRGCRTYPRLWANAPVQLPDRGAGGFPFAFVLPFFAGSG